MKGSLAALYDSREVLLAIVRRDLLVRYKQSVMGVAWALLVPLSGLLVFTVVFTRVIPIETPIPYPVFAYTGLLAWNWLAASIQFGTSSLTGNMALVTKVRFPRVVFPLSAVLVSFVDFLVASTLLGGLLLVYRIPVQDTAFLVPVLIAIQLAMSLALSLLTALGNLFFRDVRYLVGVVLPLWMFATPVVYPLSLADPQLRRLLSLNPATPLMEGYRWLLFEGRIPPIGPLALTAVLSTAALVFFWMLFHRLEHRFAEMI